MTETTSILSSDGYPMRTSRGPSLPPWLKFLLSIAVSVLVAWITSQASIREAQARLEEREGNHFSELQRAIERLSQDVRDLRADTRKAGQ